MRTPLEGIVLTHAELTSALKGRPLSPDTYAAIRNQQLAVHYIRREADSAPKVKLPMVGSLHALLSNASPQIAPEFPQSAFRRDIPLHRAYFHEIEVPEKIQPRFEALLRWADMNDPDDDDAIRFAAHLHHEFMSIFPFKRNTGKTGRLLTNYILLRHGYMPVVFHATERQRYYDTLRQSKKEMEALLRDMMTNCIDNGFKFIDQMLEQRAKRARLKTHAFESRAS